MQLNFGFPCGHGLPRALAGALTGALLLIGSPAAVTAQNLFAPAISVNGDVITNFELQQRIELLKLLRAPGDVDQLARKGLVEERLQAQAISAAGVTITDEEIAQATKEFIGRTSLSEDQFYQALEQNGVSRETLRDFVRVAATWRDLVRDKYIERARPTSAEIDRALSEDATTSDLSVLMSEIIIPIDAQNAAQVEELANQISALQSASAFEDAARQYSASPSSANGGELEWMAASKLPPALRGIIEGLSPGEISEPILLNNAVAIFRMRDIGETGGGTTSYSEIDYASYYLPGGRSPEALAAAAALKARVDRCDDLYGVAKGQPPEVLERTKAAPGQIPRDIALELSKLDPGEVSTTLTRNNGQTLVFLMLCSRTAAVNANVDRDRVAGSLIQRRLQQYADSDLGRLRANAVIIEQ